MKAIDAILAHQASLGTLYVDVPEWVVDGKPLRIFYTPMTLADRDQLSDHDGPEVDARILMIKAMDAQGKAMFDLDDMIKMKRGGNAQVVSRVALVIAKAPTSEQVEKNLQKMPS